MFNIKRILVLPILLFSINSFSQSGLGNVWYKSGIDYYKISSIQNGMHGIYANNIINAHPELDNIDPKYFHLYKNGEEIPFYLSDTNAVWTANNYLLFYGEKNNGFLDKKLYTFPGAQLNPDISLISDTSHYYLAHDPSSKGKYFQAVDNPVNTNKTLNIPYSTVASYMQTYFQGKYFSSEANVSEYTPGEGYSGSSFAKGAFQERNFPVEHIDPDFGSEVSTLVLGVSDAASGNPLYNHHLKVEFKNTIPYQLLADTMYKAYNCVSLKFNLPAGALKTTNVFKWSSVDDLSALTDLNSVAYLKAEYRRRNNIQGIKFLKFNSSYTSPSTLVFFSKSHDSVLLFNQTQSIYHKGNIHSDSISFSPNTSVTEQSYVLGSIKSQDIIRVTKFTKAKIEKLDPSIASYDQVIITSRKLKVGAANYKQYKTSIGRSVLLVYAEDLYEQYAYGQHHPMAIKHFVEHLTEASVTLPSSILLLGKGQQTNLLRNANSYRRDLVPSIGTPPADVLFVTSLDFSDMVPEIAIGRVAAENNNDIEIYLEKLKDHDSRIYQSLDSKTIVHATGGRSVGENTLFINSLEPSKGIAESEYLGARVKNYNKKVNEPVTDYFKDQIVADINRGISLLTYFGHGANYVVEVNFGEPEDISNTGKYPVYFLNGCSVGNHSADNSLGENFIFARKKGAIGWLASSGLGYPSYLSLFDRLFYQKAFKDNYGSPIGKIINETIKDFDVPSDTMSIIHSRQFVFQGDPDIKLFAPERPDYSIPDNGLFQTSKSFTGNDSVEFGIIVHNLGKTDNDTLHIEVLREGEDQNSLVYNLNALRIYHSDTLYFTIDKRNDFSGQNKISIKLDAPMKINELNESNNFLTKEFYLPTYIPIILKPKKFDSVNDTPIHFLVQTSDIYAKNILYTIEIDSTENFNSGFLKKYQWTDGPILSKKVNPGFSAEKTYYYRIKIKGEGQESEWLVNNFTYNKNIITDWLQKDLKQLTNATLNQLEINPEKKALSFISNGIEITIKTQGDITRMDSIERRIRFDNNPPLYHGNNFVGLAIISIHPNSFKRFSYPSFYNALANTPDYPYQTYIYSGEFFFDLNAAAARDSLVHYLDSIPDGYVVVGFNGRTCGFNALPENVLKALEKVGLAKVRNVAIGEPYAFVGYKGAAIGQAVEKTADLNSPIPAVSQFVRLDYFHKGKWDEGRITSERIGPVKKWNQVKWNFETNSTQIVNFEVIGIDTANRSVSLFQSSDNRDSIDVSSINSITYPYLKLSAFLKDETNQVTPTFNNWSVRYDEMPELTVLPTHQYLLEPSNPQEGDSIKHRIAFMNLTDQPVDSATVYYYLLNKNRNEKILHTHKVFNIAAFDTVVIPYRFDTRGQSDYVRLRNSIEIKGEKEKLLFNNAWESGFNIKRDTRAPKLTVTIDGKPPMNNDIISPKPVMVFKLKDENQFMLLNDTSLVSLEIKHPEDNSYRKINLLNNDVVFKPAVNASSNEMSVTYTPNFVKDGKYSLRVRVKDATGNARINTSDYNIDFEVINEASITHFYPYPNPFSTSTQFVFTLTGELPPDDIQIRIMTVSGKIVREISKAELGPINIGHNVTSFKWNGRDQFGDQLANGVYLYKVMLKSKESIKHKTTTADHFVEKGFGKLYIMR